jgi:hypothetical protein
VQSIASALEQALNVADQRELAPALVAQASSRLETVFGRDFVALAHFRPANPQELQRALDIGPSMGDDREWAINTWLAQAARVRQPLNQWRRLSFYAGAMGRPLHMPQVAQLPHVDPAGHDSQASNGYARWVGLGFDPQGGRLPAGRVSLMLHRPATPAADADWAGLLLDEWTELIPNAREDAGVVFHFDSPGAEAPQAVLIAVPPPLTERWDLDVLINTLRETLELAKMRGSDGDRLFGAILPLAYLATNAANETVSTDLSGCLETEAPSALREE